MNRTFENKGKTNFDTYRHDSYEQDYLVTAILAIIRFFALPRVKTACTALSILAAFCVMLGIDGLAAGAATAGCCAQMIGFAVISFKDNGVGGLLSQGLGTSMLQIGNIVRKPMILLAPTLTSAILGPVSTVWLQMTNNALGAGMGTSGLVGPIAAFATMSEAGYETWPLIIKIICLYFIAPAAISMGIHLVMKKLGWIQPGDMKIGE